jgi:uncharacterized protein with HEPN domain
MCQVNTVTTQATAGGKAAFVASTLHQDAVLRNLHTMTETTQRISAELKAAHPEIEWATLSAFRNVLVHDYLGIDIEVVWAVVTKDLPDFKHQSCVFKTIHPPAGGGVAPGSPRSTF